MNVPALDMENAQHRDDLRVALTDAGINTVHSSPVAGIYAFEVVMLPDDGRQALSVLAMNLNSSCQIGLSGYRRVGNTIVECGSTEFVWAESLSLAVDAVNTFLRGHELFIADFQAGRYDF